MNDQSSPFSILDNFSQFEFYSPMDLNIKGKRALVLGASSGLGFAIAKALSAEGASLVISSSNPERINAAAKEINAKGIAANLDQRGAATALVEAAAKALDGLDILVTNSGPPPPGSFSQLCLDDWEFAHQRVTMSAIESIYAALPHMKRGSWGRILLSTSCAVKEPIQTMSASVSYRAALVAAIKNISREVALDGITINALLPGYFETEVMEKYDLDAIKSEIPVGRLGKPEEYGALAAFLSSEHAAYITGQAMMPDGGMSKSW